MLAYAQARRVTSMRWPVRAPACHPYSLHAPADKQKPGKTCRVSGDGCDAPALSPCRVDVALPCACMPPTFMARGGRAWLLVASLARRRHIAATEAPDVN